jgi:putative transcriptional regulator
MPTPWRYWATETRPLPEVKDDERTVPQQGLASILDTAEGLHAAGVMGKQTMRRFDGACLTPVQPLTAEEIRALREREGASQAVFARCLNVTTGLVSQWEGGEKHPKVRPSSCSPWSPGTAWPGSPDERRARKDRHEALPAG